MSDKLGKMVTNVIEVEKNGVKVVIKQQYNKEINDINIDFSEHDKVFEDKIARLEKQIEKFKGEKSFLRTRCMPCIERDFDNGLYGKLAIVGCNEEFVDIQKYADGDDLYSREVRNLISEGGIKRLIGQYRNLSSRLDKISAENKELKQLIAELESENEQLKFDIDKMATSKSEWIDKAVEWQQKCEKLESKETESLDEVPDSITIDGYKCKIIKTESGLYISRDEIYSIIDKEKESLKQKCKELEDRHQSDCIEINRLNTAIDVLIHKVEYLRQFAGLE